MPAGVSQGTFTNIIHHSSSTLRHLVLAPAPNRWTDTGLPSQGVVLPSSLRIDQLRHLTMHTWSPTETSMVFDRAINLTSLVIHLRSDIRYVGPSDLFRTPVAVAGLPNLKEFVFIILSNSTLHGIAYLTSVVDFVIVSAPNVERLWLDIPAPSYPHPARGPQLQHMLKLKVLRLHLQLLSPRSIMRILQALPASLESIYITVKFHVWAMVST
ncbi:hypothetical protein FRC02_005795 [Tulasnella sp. 418]|nr:hypothetical protein FRC02_005795 [Tulasnella sp. 418]